MFFSSGYVGLLWHLAGKHETIYVGAVKGLFSDSHRPSLFILQVLWVAQQEIKKRKKRDLLVFNDAKYRQQWYLVGETSCAAVLLLTWMWYYRSQIMTSS